MMDNTSISTSRQEGCFKKRKVFRNDDTHHFEIAACNSKHQQAWTSRFAFTMAESPDRSEEEVKISECISPEVNLNNSLSKNKVLSKYCSRSKRNGWAEISSLYMQRNNPVPSCSVSPSVNCLHTRYGYKRKCKKSLFSDMMDKKSKIVSSIKDAPVQRINVQHNQFLTDKGNKSSTECDNLFSTVGSQNDKITIGKKFSDNDDKNVRLYESHCMDVLELPLEQVTSPDSSSISPHGTPVVNEGESNIEDFSASGEVQDYCDDSDQPCKSNSKVDRQNVALNEFDEEITGSSQNISTTQLSPEPVVKHGSEWMKRVKTPQKYEQNDEPIKTPESGKKTKKFIKGGFADQLEKIRKNINSSISIWSHQMATQKSSAATFKSLMVKIECLWCKFGLYEALCTRLSPDESIETSSTLIVFLRQLDVMKGQIKKGSVIRIHPPWQKLNLKRNLHHDVILCTYYYEVLHHHKLDCEDERETIPREVVFKWTCPCKEDASLPPDRCMLSRADNRSESSSSSSSLSNAHLVTVSAISDSEQTKNDEKILEAIEIAGGFSTSSVNITGKIVKAFILHDANGDVNQRFLIQDQDGTFALINLNPSFESSNLDRFFQRRYHITNLKVVKRTTNQRSPALFSLLAKVSRMQKGSAVPCFCYILSTTETSTMTEISSIGCDNLETPNVITLAEISREPENGMQRCDLYVTLFYVFNDYWYVSDASIAGKIVKLEIHPTCLKPNQQEFDHNSDIVLYLQDIRIYDGELIADSYSRLYDVRQSKLRISTGVYEELQLMTPKLDYLSNESNVGDVCYVSGRICRIEEDSAYWWPECNICSSNNLKEMSQKFYCEVCKIDVDDPKMRLSLEVYLDIVNLTIQKTQIRLKLQQKTIERMIPKFRVDNIYEINDILNKHLSRSSVVVEKIIKSSENDVFNLREITPVRSI